jgi:hypothetical protein
MPRPGKFSNGQKLRFWIYNGPNGRQKYRLDDRGRLVDYQTVGRNHRSLIAMDQPSPSPQPTPVLSDEIWDFTTFLSQTDEPTQFLNFDQEAEQPWKEMTEPSTWFGESFPFDDFGSVIP